MSTPIDPSTLNRILLETKSFVNGRTIVNINQTYINDEYIFYSFLLQLISAFSYWGVIYLLKK